MLEILQLISFHDHHLVAADDRIMGHLITLYSCHPSWESGRLTQHWAVRDPEPVDIITLGCCLVYVRMASSKLTMCICVLYSVTWCTACPLRYQMLTFATHWKRLDWPRSWCGCMPAWGARTSFPSHPADSIFTMLAAEGGRWCHLGVVVTDCQGADTDWAGSWPD
jgi:hypothetical protein